ncbi:MAG TPA: helix-turn-helix domain-containing protein [Conexibacter sp.]|jgi:excisionase family DNA binding protein|nr:helix-turn-helix domain-containing protein [Conexibacter sp.]
MRASATPRVATNLAPGERDTLARHPHATSAPIATTASRILHGEHGRSQSPGADSVPDVLGEIMTAQHVAELLRMQRSTVEDYGRRGLIPSIKLGRHRRYIRSDLVALIEQLR